MNLHVLSIWHAVKFAFSTHALDLAKPMIEHKKAIILRYIASAGWCLGGVERLLPQPGVVLSQLRIQHAGGL